jgi:anaerobic selenocysteine-containing dehydrogenase
MSEWRKTMCDLCPTGCGLEVLIENNHITKTRGDKDNARSQGYICRKGMNIQYHQHSARLTHPLKRVGSNFENISWDQALEEITVKIQKIIEKNGPDALGFAGEPRQHGGLLMGALGSHQYYSSVDQELGGVMWVGGTMLGSPGLGLSATPDYESTDLLLVVGWNGMMSNMAPQAARYLQAFSRDPNKILVVIDPRRSETARLARYHLPLRPGTDALLTRAMIAIILQEGWQNREYLARQSSGFDKIEPLFTNFDARKAIEVCQLDYQQVHEVCRLLTTHKSALRHGLGIEMSRHSTAISYLEMVLETICGHLGVPGGNVFHGSMLYSSPRPVKPGSPVWRSPATGFTLNGGMLPPNILPEEIMSPGPQRVRGVIVCGANPLRSWADTTAFEEAFKQLDLSVTVDMAMTESAVLSQYVLPAQSSFESWGGILPTINSTYPGIYFQLRQPILKSEGEALDTLEIITRLADKLGLIPAIPDSLQQAAGGDRLKFGAELKAWIQSKPELNPALPWIVAKTLGRAMGSITLADIWWNLYTAPPNIIAERVRAGFKEGPRMAEEFLQALVDHPSGLWVGRSDAEQGLAALATSDKRINLYVPEMVEWVRSITAESEARDLEPDARFPLILMAGNHVDTVANTQMRDPAWNKERRVSTLLMSPADASKLKLIDGQKVKITTAAGSAEIELEISDSGRAGQVIIPHGFGLDFEGTIYGVNVNYLTKNTHRDKIAGTPWHRYVPCRVERT